MEVALCAAGGGIGLAFGSFAAGEQYRLYVNPAFRAARATGRRLLLMRVLLGLACALVVALALRPDHYELGPGLLTAGFGVVLVVVASTDFERRIIPNLLTYPALLAAVALSWVWPDRSVVDIAIGTGAAVGVAALLFGVGLIFGAGALGMGDAKLIVLIGAIIGWPGAMSALFIGVIVGGLPAIAMLLLGRHRSYYSYGPYLALGAVIVMLWPERFF